MHFVLLLGIFTAPLLAEPVCRERPAAQWQNQLNQWVDLLTGRSPVEHSLSATAGEIANCRDAIAKAGLTPCFDNLTRYAADTHRMSQPGHGAGYTVPDRQYIDEINRRNPNLLTLPAEFANGLPANWRDIAKNKGWNTLEYRSWSIGNPPFGHFSRVLIHIKKDGYDQWLQFTVPDSPGDNRGASLINVMGVEKRATDLRPSPGFAFAEYSLDRGGVNPRLKPFNYSCYGCHPSGGRQIVPAPGSVHPSQQGALDAMNAAMRGYGGANFYRANTDNHGPHRGQTQGCTSCHNNFNGSMFSARAAMGAHTGHGDSGAQFKMLVEFSMPPQIRMADGGRAFFNARDKISTLNDEQRRGLLEAYGGLPEQMQNRAILAYLKSINKLTEAEHEAALKGLAYLTERQTKSFERMTNEYPNQLRTWLLGGRENCAAPSRPAPPTLGNPPRAPTIQR